MGFRKQTNLYQCGPYSLKHALIMLGVLVDEGTISKVARTDATGTDERGLARAARRFNCDLLERRKIHPDDARKALVDTLRQGRPCLVCVHQWRHWVAVVKEERGRFILLDSEDVAVLTIVTWKELKNLWVYHPRVETDSEEENTWFDLYCLIPRFRVQMRAKFSLARARYLRRPENRDLAQQWDEYLRDLLQVCKPRTPLSENVISLGEFLRRHEEMIVHEVAYWHGGIGYKETQKVLRNMRFVADTHGLIVHRDDEKRTIAGLTALLTLWAGSNYGIGPVYPARKRPRKIPKKSRRRANR